MRQDERVGDLRGRIRAGVSAVAVASVAVLPWAGGSAAAHAEIRAVASGECNPTEGTVVEDPGTTVPWAQESLGLDAQGGWTLTRCSGVRVAVVDTGVDTVAPVLPQQALLPGANTTPGGGGVQDCDGHGTAVAAIIAGRGGVGAFVGVAPEAQIIPVQVASSAQNSDSDSLARGIVRAADSGAKVINVSMTTATDTPALDQAVRHAHDAGALIVAASGNFDTREGCLYPAALDGVLAVGAVGRGGAAWKSTEVCAHTGVAAPGDTVATASARAPGHLATDSGTSMAAAFVSGTAALILAYHPDLTPDQLIHRIEATADRPASDFLPDPRVGWGTVNPYRAVTMVLPGEEAETTAPGPTTPETMPLPDAATAKPDRVARAAVLTVLGAALFALAVAAAAVTAQHGRRRSWRPGGPG